MPKLIAIGDTHGRFDLLELLLGKITEQIKDEYKLIFLGDMVDRGPQSFEVVDTIKRLTEQGKAIALLGNHDDMMLDYVRNGWVNMQDLWMLNGARRTVESYGKAMRLYGHGKFFTAIAASGHFQWLRTLPLYFETEEFWFSHAPVPCRAFRRFDDHRIDKQALIWSFHGEYGQSEDVFAEDLGKLQVVGHIHDLQRKNTYPRIYKHIAYIDTGCGCRPNAPLTAAVLENGKILQIIQVDQQDLLNKPLQS